MTWWNPYSKRLNILLEWNKILLPQTCKLSYIFSVIFALAKFVSKCFVILCQKPAISTGDCCMESICWNTEIPAVIVCPERDYRIFLNWSSIHLSIKIQAKARNVKGVSSAPEAFTMPDRTVRVSPLKRLIFEISLFQLYLASISHCIRFFWHLPCGNSELCEVLWYVEFPPGP